MGTPTGRNRFDPALIGFQRYGALFPGRNGRPEPVEAITVTALLADEADRLWVAMQPRDDALSAPAAGYRIFAFDRASGIDGPTLPAARTALALESAGGHVVQILEDRAHRLWFGRASGGLMHHDPQSGATDRIVANPGSREGLASNGVSGLAVGLTGEIWVLAVDNAEAGGVRPRGFTASIPRLSPCAAWSCVNGPRCDQGAVS